MQRLRLAACGVATATAVFLVLPVLDVGGLRGWIPLWLVPFVAAAFLAPTTVGLLIALRQPGNRIAWIMLTGAFVVTVQFPLVLALGEGWGLQIDRATWPLLYAWPIAVAFVFPNGRLLSPRWRWVIGAAIVSFVGVIGLMLLNPGPFDGDVVDEIGGAIGDLRQIAAGVRPARLDDGLSAALADLARTAPIPVDVDVPVERVQASVEAAAYFVACEALTNAVRYASASRVSMRAVRQNGTLLVSITDDGVGGAVVRRGSGLAGLQDRVAAHGGTLAVSSPRGRGTRVEVAIPCES